MRCCWPSCRTPMQPRPRRPVGIAKTWNVPWDGLRRCAHRRADQEPHVGRRLHREAGAAPRHYIDRPPRVRPTLVLFAIHPEFTARDLANLDIDAAQLEFAQRKTHRGAAIAAAPRLMKHQRAVFAPELLNEPAGRVGYPDTARIKLNHVA